MLTVIKKIIGPKVTENVMERDNEFERLGAELKREVNAIFGRSLFIRELDSGSDNSVEIELVNLTTPYYDVERFGVSFVASPRHADAIMITGAVTVNMSVAVKKVYEATPEPKWVIAVGDDACTGGVFKESYAVLGGAEKVIPIDMRILGNPPTPQDILQGLLALMKKIRTQKKR